MAKATMYPTGVSQPNRNKASGLQGKCFMAVTRSGGTYEISCRDQKDPKYHHEWSNAEEILKGKTIQCGRPSTKMCSHETYYGIKGYRNTCPIAGVSGTYTQPATLRLFFNLKKKGISSSAKIEKVQLSFEHRCTGVDVGNGKESTTWGPNFSGASHYPSRHALTVKIGNTKKILDKNPPLSSKFSSTGNFTFTNVTYEDLTSKGVDIIYGNNLETNPGNIYLKNLTIDIWYQDGTPYIEGTQGANSLYISDVSNCRSSIKFTLDAGYKQGTTKMSVNDAPKDLRNSVIAETPSSDIVVSFDRNVSGDKTKRKVVATVTDNTLKEGEKTIKFSVKGTNKSISFKYKAVKKGKPKITIPNRIERNTQNKGITSITAKDGCTNLIQVYDESIATNPIYTFNSFNRSDTNNIIPKANVDAFYNVLALLPCGWHTLFFKFDNNSKEIVERKIEIIPTTYKFKITETNGTTEVDNPYTIIQDKSNNHSLKLTYVKTKDLINKPSFKIINSTHGKKVNGQPTSQLIDNKDWNNVNIAGASTTFDVGTYYPGEYEIKIQDKESTCADTPEVFKVNITPKHKQYFDEIFVRGEDSTAFNYDYLVALEGDSITEPLYVNTVTLGASYKDIKICADKNNNNTITGLTQINTVNLTVTNTSNNDIENLFLELNTLIKDDDDLLQVTSNEWLESDGIFYNFKENFDTFNKNFNGLVSIKNLTSDDDNVDEEDVYIHIDTLKAQSSIDIKIPYGCAIEKEVWLQILLFGQPLALYEQGHCSDDTKLFDLIHLQVYDSILTDMSITGESDLFSTDTLDRCPNECFRTSMTYNIKNIDTTTLEEIGTTIIRNDPRLVPYRVDYQSNTYPVDIKNINNELYPSNITFDIDTKATRISSISGARIDLYLKLDKHEEIHLHQYTDYNGEATIFLTIPKTIGGTYTVDELLPYMSIEYSGNMYYIGTKHPENGYQTGNNIGGVYENKNYTKIKILNKTPIKYFAGQVIPIKIKLEGHIKYLKNNIIFKPQINIPGRSDNITVYYKICNLENNEGILNTQFKTDSYHFVPNEINKKIYCGVDTDITLDTKLSKVIVENKALNRLYLALTNRKRNNKEVKVVIKENMSIEKYDMLNYNVDKGIITIENNQIVWNIDYIDEDSVVRGYIDFKAKEIGYSILETTVTDFIDNMRNKPVFGKESYKCECRKEI